MKSQYPALVSSLNNLALLRRMERRYSEAEPFYQEAWEIAELVWGANHPITQTIRANLETIKQA